MRGYGAKMNVVHLALVLCTFRHIQHCPCSAEQCGDQPWVNLVSEKDDRQHGKIWRLTKRNESLPWNGHAGEK